MDGWIEVNDDSSGEETIEDKFVLINDANSDEEPYTYAAFATCEEAEEVVALMQQRIQQQHSSHEVVLDTGAIIIDEYGNPVHTLDTEDVKEIKIQGEPENKPNIWHINQTEQKNYENQIEIGNNDISVIAYEPDGTQQTNWNVVPTPEEIHCNVVSVTSIKSHGVNEDGSSEYESQLANNNTNNKSHICPYCGNNHCSAGPLKLHMRACRRKKYPKKDIKCTVCGKTFQDDRNFRQHLLFHYGGYCTRCFRSFRNEKKLKEHIEEHKLQDEKSVQFNGQNVQVKAYTCCNCSKQFSVVFEGGCVKRRYVCDPCREMFTNAEKLKQPTRVTKRKHEYSCDICDRRFVFIGSLHRHLDECALTSPHGSRKLVVK